MGRMKIKTDSKDVLKLEEKLKVPEAALSWLQARRQWFVGGGIAVLVVLVLVWAYASYEQVRGRRAQMQYAQILSKIASQNDPHAQAWVPLIAELKQLCESYRGTKAALCAQLDLAQAYYQTGQYDPAVMWDLKSLQDLKANPAAQALARLRLVLSYRALNRLDEALAQCEAVQKMSLPSLSREVQWQMGQIYAAKQDTVRAAEYYQKALAEAGTYPAQAIIQEGLARLRSSNPSQ